LQYNMNRSGFYNVPKFVLTSEFCQDHGYVQAEKEM
jgi:hypothetical protein